MWDYCIVCIWGEDILSSMKKHILTIGNPVYDLILTPALQVRERVLSGCSTNASLAVAKMGEQAVLLGTVGPDFAARLYKDLNHYGIQSELFASRQTGGFSLVYDGRGNRELSILGIADPIPVSADGFNENEIDMVLLGPILGEISVDLVKYIKSRLSVPILLDPQGLLRRLDGEIVIHEITDEFIQIAPLSSIVKANELETQTVTGIDPRLDPEGAVKALFQFGPEIAVVTLAEAGSIIYDGKKITIIPPYTTNAIDPTGAGDTYAAGFMVKYLETPNDLLAVGCFASAVASVMVENSGPAFPLTRQEVDARTARLLVRPHQLLLS